MPFREAVIGGRAVGVPGVPRLLEVAHARHGRLAWAALFQPAIDLAEKGFAVSPRLHFLLETDWGLARNPAANAYFFDAAGKPRAVGALLKNPELARTLRAIAAHGADAFYEGAIGRDIVAAVRGYPGNPGTLRQEDLSGYRVRDVTPLCGRYRRQWKVCGMPPSSSGGIAVLEVLGILEHFDIGAMRPGSTQAVHVIAEAERLAFADRNRYVGDDRFVEVPAAGMIDPAYTAERYRLIHSGAAMGRARAGVPRGARSSYVDDPVDEIPGTSHISIVDKDGNAVAMTTTIESPFGSQVMVHGFLLNNQLTDFNFLPRENGQLVANGVYPGKRPRSSMAPTLVFDSGGSLKMVVGSAGGSFIIGHVVKTLVAALDWRMDVQSAVDLPNFGSRNGPTEIEKGSEYERLAGPLRAIGHEVRLMDMTSGIDAVVVTKDGLEGGADPRREAVAKGR
jgi:gamma-glutamyltranspeptidase/glutathione hydrolase